MTNKFQSKKTIHYSLFTIHYKRGFTLVELLLFMGIFSIFLIVLTDLFSAIINTRIESEATSSVEEDGRFIISRLAYDISRADSITSPALGSGANSLSIVIGGVTYTYQVSSGNFQLTNDLGTNNLNSSETTVSTPIFQRIGNSDGKDTIKITFTVNSVTQKITGSETQNFQTTIGRR